MGSSSKAKSSKKRSSKIHSQPRKMKRVKKSRSSKSKKVARRHDTSSDDSMSSLSISPASNDSYSLYSDTDSMSSVSFSSSSSEGTYRGKKKVSHLRSKLKSTRKRVRRRSSSSEDFSRTKKRKRSRKNADSKSWKKSQKNKSRRIVRNSSATSDSHDCSTCKEESGSLSEESAGQKLMFKSRKNKRHKRESREERVGSKKRSHRSPRSSSYSSSRDQSYSGSRGDEIFVGEHNSRRLRSVIIFAEQAHEKEGNKSEKDSPKEEIVYDQDDYPSPRSNGSSSGGSKRDVNSCSPVPSSEKRHKENVEGQETCVSNVTAAEVTESRKNANDPKVHDPFSNEVEMNKYKKESRTYGSVLDANLGADDLEVVLRQKALENLRKFRGGIQRNANATTNQINNTDGNAKESFSSKAEIVQRVLPKEDDTNVIDHGKILERSTRSTSSMGGASYSQKDIADRGNTATGSGIAKQKATHPPDGLALSVSSSKEDHATTQAAVAKSESQNSVSGRKTSSMNSSLNKEMTLQSSPDNKLNENRESERKILPETTNSITSGITNNSEAGVNKASIERSTSQGQGSNQQQQTESKDGAQFEQKTMSVMRGGEMVQVNYKVYIPKRAPALSRRQLKR